MWVPTFLCACGASMPGQPEREIGCPRCGRRLERKGDVFRCLAPERHERIEPFLAQYRRVREQDGYRIDRADYYRALPETDDNPRWATWVIRRRSFRRLCDEVLEGRAAGSPAVLDLGAGCGWLSHRLTRLGCRTVAVDLLADDQDGLGAGHYYEIRFPCVQADFDALPFAPAQFDFVVFNASLHYSADVLGTLDHASRMLNAGGVIVVIDSPTFARDEDGRRMRTRLRNRLRDDYGVTTPIEPGEGFLTFDRLAAWARSSGRSFQFFSSLEWRSQFRDAAQFLRGRGRRPARFGVWIAA